VDSMMGIRTDSQTQSLAHWKWRLIWLFLQVAWTILSESSDQLEFVPVLNEYGVSMWNNRSQIRTHVCEVLRCFLILFACSYDGTHELTPLQHVYSRRLTPRAQSESELCLWHPLYPWKCRFSWYWTACTNWRQRDVMSILWKPETSLLNSKGTPPRIAGRTNWRDPWISRRVIAAARNHINLHPKVWFFSVGRMVHALNFHNYSHTDVPERYEDGSTALQEGFGVKLRHM
jgi:hypothetical protein